MTERLNTDAIARAKAAVEGLDLSALEHADAAPVDRLRGGRNDLAASIAAAGGAQPEVPPIPESEYQMALKEAQDKIAGGTSLDVAVGDFARKIGARPSDEKALRDYMVDVNRSIRQLQSILKDPSVSDEERQAIAAALSHPTAEIEIPDTAATRSAIESLREIEERIKNIQVPPALKRYSSAMWLRPAGEVGGAALEGGLATLIVSSLMYSSLGVLVVPHTAGHLLTYAGSALLWNFGVHMTSKADALKGVANTGSVRRGLTQWAYRGRNGKISARKIPVTTLRLASLGLLMAGGIAMAQAVLSNTDESERNASLVSEPLRQQRDKISDFETRLRASAGIIPKILSIARRVESGKQSGASTRTVEPPPSPAKKGKQAPPAAPRASGGWIPYSPAEIESMKKNELEPLFIASGLDVSLLAKLTFQQPSSLGEGPAWEFKQAIETGDYSKLRELRADDISKLKAKLTFLADAKNTQDIVERIRARMGLASGERFEAKVASLVDTFLRSRELALIYGNLEEALRIGQVIRAQGESVKRTFVSAFLEGTPPLGLEAVLPFVNPIIEQNEAIKELARKSISEPITSAIGTMSDALGAVGGSVQTPPLPEWQLDVSPLIQLSQTIERLTEQAAGSAHAEAASKSSMMGVLNTFVPGLPGSQKAQGAERWVAKTVMQYRGYRVVSQGDKTLVYERIGGAAREGYNTASADAWNLFLMGPAGRASTESAFPSDLNLQKATTMSDQEMGAAMKSYLDHIVGNVRNVRSSQPNNTDLGRMLTEYEQMTRLSDAQLGLLVRNQVSVQFGMQRIPILYPASVWARLTGGDAPPNTGIDTRLWAETTAKADPSFSENLVSGLSAINDKELGVRVLTHLRTVVAAIEKDPTNEYMLRQYRAMISTASNDAKVIELGALARKQLAYQIDKRMSPPAVFPAGLWSIVLDPSLGETTSDILDPALWKQLPEAQAKALFDSYLKSARIEALAGPAALVLMLTMMTFVISLVAVRNKNKNLLRTKDRFIEDWHQVEREILSVMGNFNAALRQIPFFASLPPMDPYMLLAAFRKLGEEYESDLRTDHSIMEKFGHEMQGALAKGPYADAVLEIFAMEGLLERLQTDPKAVQRLQDIIAPGLSEVAALTANSTVPGTGTNPMDAFFTTMSALDLSGQELLRNAARGHLRFRREVTKARRILNERSLDELKNAPEMQDLLQVASSPVSLETIASDTFAAPQLSQLEILIKTGSENVTRDVQELNYDAMIERLDTDAIAEEMLKRYKAPWALTRRADTAARSEEFSEIRVPAKGEPLGEFSLVAGLANDERALVASADRGGKRMSESARILFEGSAALRAELGDSHPGHTFDIQLSVDADGEVAFTLADFEDAASGRIEVSRQELPIQILGEAFHSPYTASHRLNSIIAQVVS